MTPARRRFVREVAVGRVRLAVISSVKPGSCRSRRARMPKFDRLRWAGIRFRRRLGHGHTYVPLNVKVSPTSTDTGKKSCSLPVEV